MAGAGQYWCLSVSEGHHINETAWIPLIDERLQVTQKDTNECDKCSVAISKEDALLDPNIENVFVYS